MGHVSMLTEERTPQCTMCDKTFSNDKTKLNHLCTYTGEKLFQLSYCDNVTNTPADSYK